MCERIARILSFYACKNLIFSHVFYFLEVYFNLARSYIQSSFMPFGSKVFILASIYTIFSNSLFIKKWKSVALDFGKSWSFMTFESSALLALEFLCGFLYLLKVSVSVNILIGCTMVSFHILVRNYH